jgi:hypothetical protein
MAIAIQREPIGVISDVAQALTDLDSEDLSGAGQFAVSSGGHLAYVRSPVVPYPEGQLVTVDRRGVVTPLDAQVKS